MFFSPHKLRYATLSSLLLFTITSLYAQMGKQLSFGIIIPSTSKTTIDVVGKTGFEISYHLFAKYSDKLEWMSGFGYINAPYEFASFVEDHEFNTSIYSYKPSTEKATMHILNYDYSLSYFVVPDMLAICGGANIGFAVGGADTRTSGDRVLYSKTDLTQPSVRYTRIDTRDNPDVFAADSDLGIEDSFYKMFIYGVHIGANFTYNDRYKLYAVYNLYLNQQLGQDEFSEFMGAPQARLLRIGVSYKFLPAYKKLRF